MARSEHLENYTLSNEQTVFLEEIPDANLRQSEIVVYDSQDTTEPGIARFTTTSDLFNTISKAVLTSGTTDPVDANKIAEANVLYFRIENDAITSVWFSVNGGDFVEVVTAGYASWAGEGNTDPIPTDKLPEIPDAKIPGSIARDAEITSQIAAEASSRQSADTELGNRLTTVEVRRPFAPMQTIGSYQKSTTSPIAGRYYPSSDRVEVAHVNGAGDSKQSELQAVSVGYGLVVADKVLVITFINQQASYVEYHGYWVNGAADAVTAGQSATIQVIQHELRLGRYTRAEDLLGILPLNKVPPAITNRLTTLELNILSAGHILDAHDGLPPLPDYATTDADTRAEWLRTIAVGTNGHVYTVEVVHLDGSDAAGSWIEYTHVNFLGVRGIPPTNPQSGQYYYDTSHRQWILYQNLPISGLTPERVRFRDIFGSGSNNVWLNTRDSESAALHAITSFDNTKTYYAEFGGRIWYLNNSTYSAPTSPSYKFKWILTNKVTNDEIEALRTLIGTKANTTALSAETLARTTEDSNLGARITTLENAPAPAAPTLEEADVQGTEIARTAALPTTARTTAFTTAWTLATSVAAGVTTAGGVLRLPKIRPSDDTFGILVAAYEGDTRASETVFEFGAGAPDQASAQQSDGARIIRWDNGETIAAEYYHDNTNGDSVRLIGIGRTLPATATVRVYWAISGNASSDSGSQGQQGASETTPNLIQLTQWRRSATKPTAPGTVSRNNDGTFSGFPGAGWNFSIPSGNDPLWIAFDTLLRDSMGVWGDATSWTVASVDSTLVQFYDASTGTWIATPNANTIEMRFWTVENGWQSVALSTDRLLLTSNVNNVWTALPQALSVSDVADIRRVVFRVQNGDYDCSPDIMALSLWGDLSSITQAVPDSSNYQTRDTKAAIVSWGNEGKNGVQVINTRAVSRGDLGGLGGFFVKSFKNASNQLTHLSFHNPWGTASSNCSVQVYLEY